MIQIQATKQEWVVICGLNAHLKRKQTTNKLSVSS